MRWYRNVVELGVSGKQDRVAADINPERDSRVVFRRSGTPNKRHASTTKFRTAPNEELSLSDKRRGKLRGARSHCLQGCNPFYTWQWRVLCSGEPVIEIPV
jgi:hypothetical protein